MAARSLVAEYVEPIPRTLTLMPLTASPIIDPAAWRDVAARGPGTVAVLRLHLPDGDPERLAASIERLLNAGVRPLVHVSLGYGTRPLADVLGVIARWSVLPIVGAFLDHAPASPYQVGPVVYAVRAARRAGLTMIVLNPGVPVDPIYRRLDATICTFEGSWSEYLDWPGAIAGDGHLVYGVPESERDAAWALVTARRAGLVMLSERTVPQPLDAIPA